MSNVKQFRPEVVGEAVRLEPDAILEAAKGQGFRNVMILAEMADGGIWASGSAGAGETLVLMERAKRQMIFDD